MEPTKSSRRIEAIRNAAIQAAIEREVFRIYRGGVDALNIMPLTWLNPVAQDKA